MNSASFYNFVVAGKVNDPSFHKCIAALKFLKKDNPKSVDVTIFQFFETQWEEYLRKIKIEKKGHFYHHKQSPLVFFNDTEYIGDAETFQEWVLNEFRYTDKTSDVIYKKKANDSFKQLIENTPGR